MLMPERIYHVSATSTVRIAAAVGCLTNEPVCRRRDNPVVGGGRDTVRQRGGTDMSQDDNPTAFALAAARRAHSWVQIPLVLLLLAGLPAAVWLDLRSLSESALRLQASDFNSVITSVRSYY